MGTILSKIVQWRWSKSIAYISIYILLVLAVNILFVYAPVWSLWGGSFSSGDIVVGIVYVMRDLAQRAIGNMVIAAMLAGCFFTYLLTQKDLAIASLVAFSVGEFLDWIIFTLTKKPLSQRLLLSCLVTVPVDSAIFLFLIHQLNFAGFTVMTGAKASGVIALWYIWKLRDKSASR